jgi:hypothetical protein
MRRNTTKTKKDTPKGITKFIAVFCSSVGYSTKRLMDDMVWSISQAKITPH